MLYCMRAVENEKLWEGDEGCALVYRYVWRDYTSVTSDE